MIRHLIALDFDGTCARYKPNLGYDTPLLDCLRPLLDDGVAWVMNTDRPFFQMREASLALEPTLRPCALLLRQRDIYDLNSHDYEPHHEWNEARTRDHDSLWSKITEHVPEWEQRIEREYTVLERFVDGNAFAFMVPPEEMNGLRALMREMVSPWPEAQVSGNADWSFVLHASFSKARVLRIMADRLELPHEQVIAVGDGLNDLTMLDGSVTPRVGCPANACGEVKEAVRAAGGVIASVPDAAGTVQVIRHYLNIA